MVTGSCKLLGDLDTYLDLCGSEIGITITERRHEDRDHTTSTLRDR